MLTSPVHFRFYRSQHFLSTRLDSIVQRQRRFFIQENFSNRLFAVHTNYIAINAIRNSFFVWKSNWKKSQRSSSSSGDGINDEWNNSNNETKWDNIWIEKWTKLNKSSTSSNNNNGTTTGYIEWMKWAIKKKLLLRFRITSSLSMGASFGCVMCATTKNKQHIVGIRSSWAMGQWTDAQWLRNAHTLTRN